MRLKLFTFLAISSVLLGGCKNSEENIPNAEENNQPTETTPDIEVEASIDDQMDGIEDKSIYNIKFKYNDNYFKNDASTFNKDLMLLSFGAENSVRKKGTGEKFFSDIGFSVLYTAEEYETGDNEHSIQYFISKKTIDDFTVFSVTIRGHQYGREWADNLTLGESGNHEGFYNSASKIYNKLLPYISEEHNYKLWFTGYSRAGAVSNVLSHLVLSNANLGINESNLFTYTFEAPRALTKENAKPYKNVFNIYNSADLISNLAPEKYGLYRCGKDVDIFDPNIDKYLPSFSSEASLPEFTKNKGVYSNDKEFTEYVLKQLLKEDTSIYNPSKYPYDLCSREHFYEIQDSVSYLVGHILQKTANVTYLSNKFSGMTASEILSYLTDEGQKLYDVLKDTFEANKVSYDETQLLSSCEVASLLAKRYSSLFTKLSQNSNILRTISFHLNETIYVLIQRINTI